MLGSILAYIVVGSFFLSFIFTIFWRSPYNVAIFHNLGGAEKQEKWKRIKQIYENRNNRLKRKIDIADAAIVGNGMGFYSDKIIGKVIKGKNEC